MNRFFVLLVVVFALGGCGNFGARESDNAESFEGEAMEAVSQKSFAYDSKSEEDMESRAGNSSEPLNPGEKIIRTGHLEIQANDYEAYLHHLRSVVKQHSGYIGTEHEKKSSWRLSNEFEIRVPNKQFEALIDQLTTGNGFLHVNSKRIEALDVGEEYADIEARLKTKKAVEAQYLDILKQAKTIQDILNVREQLRRIREEIDSYEGRKKYLENKISFSTIYLEVFQTLDGEVIEKPGFFHRSGNAFKNGWKGIQEGIIIIFGFWPIWILVAVVILLWRRRRRRRTGK